LVHDFAASVTGRAGGRTGPGLGAFARAALALLDRGYLDFRADAEDRILEADFQIVADVFAALRAVAPLPAATAKIGESEDIAQDIREMGEGARIEPAVRRRTQALVAESVIGSALLRIAQHAIGFGGFFEGLLGLPVVRVTVGMMLQGESPIGRLDRLIVR